MKSLPRLPESAPNCPGHFQREHLCIGSLWMNGTALFTWQGPMPNLLGSEFKAILAELLRPWKLFTLAVGLGLLVAGSFYVKAPDWDIPISFIMGILAYLTAPWSLRIILERRWRRLPMMLLLTWFTVDGCYWLYWHFRDPVALRLMRAANAPASLALYGMCGLIWQYCGTARSLALEIFNKVFS